jgi:hypothetical protein
MNLTLPTVGATTGPQWANQLNGDLETIDSHDHTPNNGVQIPVAGININDDLTFNAKSAVDVATIGFLGLGSQLSQTLIQRLYVYNGDLYYNDGSGIQIPITLNGSVNVGSSGNISGLGVAPYTSSSAAFSGGIFTWSQGVNTPARMDCGSVIVRPESASSFGVRLVSPSGIAGANEDLTLPRKPAAQSLVTMSSTGVQTTATVNSTLTLTSSSLSVATDGITATQLATASVTAIKMGAATYNKSSSTGNAYTISASTTPATVPALSLIFSAVNTRPIVMMLENDQSGTASTVGATASWGVYFEVVGPSGTSKVANCSLTANTYLSPSSISAMYIPSAGLHTINVFVVRASAGPIALTNTKLVAYQI